MTFRPLLVIGIAKARFAAQPEYVVNLTPLYYPNPPIPFNQDLWERAASPLPKAKVDDVVNLLPIQVPIIPTTNRLPAFNRLASPQPKAKVDDLTNLRPIQSVVVVTAPFNQDLWENPARIRLTATGEINNSIFVVTAPFVQDDWTRIQSTQKAKVDDVVNLLPLRAVVVAAAPFSQSIWDNTKAGPWKVKVDDVVNLIQAIPTTNRLPAFNSLASQQSKAKVDDVVNLLPVHSIVVAAAAPFSQSIWDRAAVPPWRVKIDDVVNLQPLQTIYQLRTPTIARPADPRWKATGEVFGTLSPLLTPPPAQPPFFQTDWPLPTRGRPSLPSEVYFGAFPLYSPNPSRPFTQSAWENAKAALAKAKVDDVINLPRRAPFTQSDWPLASAPRAKTKVDDVVKLTPRAPFTQSDWGLPAALRAKAKVDDFVNLPTPPVAVVFPFFASDWPLAAPPARKITDTSAAAPLTLYGPTPRPFSQSDWPSATPARAKAQVDFVTNLLLSINPNYEFREPIIAPIAGTRKAIVDDFVNIPRVSAPIVLPFSQSDWPLCGPQKPKAIDASVALSLPRSFPNPTRPFAQRLWDNATRLSPFKSLGDALAPPNPLIFPNPARPFGQGDWPSSARAGPSDRSFAAGLNLPIAVPPIPPPPTVGINPMIGAYPHWRQL